MSIEKATEPSAAEMLSTMEVRVRMLPCSGESAALSRSASQRQKEKNNDKQTPATLTASRSSCRVIQTNARVWDTGCAHPRCCSSACTAQGCCSTRGCCSRCCRSWARWMTTPVAMEMHTHTQGQKLLSFTRQPRSRTPHCVFLRHPPSRQRTSWAVTQDKQKLPWLFSKWS